MIPKFIIIFIYLCSCQLFAQGEQVIISEKKTGKRIVLRAENKTADTLNVFLMIQSEGYRRSANKPVLKNIPPNSIVPMITLIELANVPSSYSYELIVNDTKKSVELDYGKEVVDIQNAIKGKIVIFTLSNCQKCTLLSTALVNSRTTHLSFDIAKDPVLYRQFMKFIENELTEQTRIQFPVIWNKDYTIFGYDDLETLIAELVN